jgi:hypothetical protein
MQSLLEAGIYLKPEMCEFHQETIRYLGLIMSTKGISMDEDTVDTIQNWSREKKTKNGWQKISLKYNNSCDFAIIIDDLYLSTLRQQNP